MIIQIDENVILSGSLAKDAESKSFNKGERTFTTYSCSVAVDKIRQENGEFKTIWANCYSWNPALGKLKKGEKVFAVGKHEVQTYVNREGIESTAEKVNVEFVLSQGKPSYSGSSQQPAPQEVQSFQEVPIDELPF